MSNPTLSGGCLRQMIAHGKRYGRKPILQVLEAKQIVGGSAKRYKLCMSDGINCSSSIVLHRQLNNLIKKNKENKFAIVKIDSYALLNEKSMNFLVIFGLTILKTPTRVGRFIGRPIPLNIIEAPKAESSVPQLPVLQSSSSANTEDLATQTINQLFTEWEN